jgi:hypothetical protein
MAPKKSIADQLRARLSPSRGHPEEGVDDDQEEFNPPLNQQGASDFDVIVGNPSRKDKGSASGSASAASTRATPYPQDDFILQQSAQREQLKQLFLLVSSLGNKIEAVAEVVAESNSINRRIEPPESGPSQQEKGKAASRSVSFAKEVDEKEDENDDDEDRGTDSGDDYVSHGLYRDIIAEGFDKRSPSRLAPNKPAYFPIDDPVTRTLTASKYSAKAQEYSITVANAFFASVTKAALDDAISAALEGDEQSALTLLAQVSNNMAAIEDMHRDRMLFLDLTSDPNSSATERDYANNILRNEFIPGVQNKGGSARSNKMFAAYQTQYLKATQFASAKASASRHLASSTGSGYGSGSTGSSGSTAPNPASKTQQKKKAAKDKAAAGGKPAAAGEKEVPAGAKPAWKKGDEGRD